MRSRALGPGPRGLHAPLRVARISAASVSYVSDPFALGPTLALTASGSGSGSGSGSCSRSAATPPTATVVQQHEFTTSASPPGPPRRTAARAAASRLARARAAGGASQPRRRRRPRLLCGDCAALRHGSGSVPWPLAIGSRVRNEAARRRAARGRVLLADRRRRGSRPDRRGGAAVRGAWHSHTPGLSTSLRPLCPAQHGCPVCAVAGTRSASDRRHAREPADRRDGELVRASPHNEVRSASPSQAFMLCPGARQPRSPSSTSRARAGT